MDHLSDVAGPTPKEEAIETVYLPKKIIETESDDLPVLNQVFMERWEVKEKIGRGAHAQVYLAFDTIEMKHVAIKVSMKLSKKRENEAFFLLKLGGHRNFPELIHFVTNDYMRFLVMELVGPTLLDIARHFRPLSLKSVSRLGMQMIDAMEHLHAQGYLHSDIKTSNFAVGNSPDKRNTVYLIDFGLSYSFGHQDGCLCNPIPYTEFQGTDTYASLFLLDGAQRCRRDDLYGILIISLELLTELPWKCLPTIRYLRKCIAERTEPEIIEHFGFEFLGLKRYLDSLTYYDTPNYDKCRMYFQRLSEDSNPTHKFEWELDPEKLWTTGHYEPFESQFDKEEADFVPPQYALPEVAQEVPDSSFDDLQEAAHMPQNSLQPIPPSTSMMPPTPDEVIPDQDPVPMPIQSQFACIKAPPGTPAMNPYDYPATAPRVLISAQNPTVQTQAGLIHPMHLTNENTSCQPLIHDTSFTPQQDMPRQSYAAVTASQNPDLSMIRQHDAQNQLMCPTNPNLWCWAALPVPTPVFTHSFPENVPYQSPRRYQRRRRPKTQRVISDQQPREYPRSRPPRTRQVMDVSSSHQQPNDFQLLRRSKTQQVVDLSSLNQQPEESQLLRHPKTQQAMDVSSPQQQPQESQVLTPPETQQVSDVPSPHQQSQESHRLRPPKTEQVMDVSSPHQQPQGSQRSRPPKTQQVMNVSSSDQQPQKSQRSKHPKGRPKRRTRM